MKEKIIVALRYSRLYVPTDRREEHMSVGSAALVERLAEHGYTLSEDAIQALSAQSEDYLKELVSTIESVYGTNLNWTPLVRDWHREKNIEWTDYLVTAFANAFHLGDVCEGTTLPCGHFIPEGVFDLTRFNGCPFCGTPFVTTPGVKGVATGRKRLTLADDAWLKELYRQLLESKVPLDATQAESLMQLSDCYGVPTDVTIAMRETAAIISGNFFEQGLYAKAFSLLDTPFDLLRMLWMLLTCKQRFISPQALGLNPGAMHYSRSAGRAAAIWLDSLTMSAADMCRSLNAQREMWVHAQRALRLPEYARRLRLTHLAEFLDLFYRGDYDTWAGRFNEAYNNEDQQATLALLSERPGEFARRLFSTMMTFKASDVLDAFKKIAPRLPLRLVVSLDNNAIPYFMPQGDMRTIVLPSGASVRASLNRWLYALPAPRLAQFAADVKTTVLDIYDHHFKALRSADEEGRRVYIAPGLYNIPVPVGDRSNSIQDASYAVQGQRFDVESDRVRLFMQWGEGLPAQHLDMDLSCRVLYANGGEAECAYYSLDLSGVHHSGDIQSIPNMVGTAEYIEIDIPQLIADEAKYVVFTCNAFSCDELALNMKFGWMDCAYTMTLTYFYGVAYNPGEVQHIVRVPEGTTARGLVFGVLDVDARQVIWLEMPVSAQILAQINTAGIMSLLDRLKSKISVGELLGVRSRALGMTIVDTADEADIAYPDLLAAMPDLFA